MSMREYTIRAQLPDDPYSAELFEVKATDQVEALKLGRERVRKDYLPGMKVTHVRPYVAEFTIISYA